MSQQVHYISAALIPAENVENNQEHFVANKVVVLCTTSLSLRNHSYAYRQYFESKVSLEKSFYLIASV